MIIIINTAFFFLLLIYSGVIYLFGVLRVYDIYYKLLIYDYFIIINILYIRDGDEIILFISVNFY